MKKFFLLFFIGINSLSAIDLNPYCLEKMFPSKKSQQRVKKEKLSHKMPHSVETLSTPKIIQNQNKIENPLLLRALSFMVMPFIIGCGLGTEITSNETILSSVIINCPATAIGIAEYKSNGKTTTAQKIVAGSYLSLGIATGWLTRNVFIPWLQT